MRRYVYSRGGKLHAVVFWLLCMILVTAFCSAALAAETVLTLEMALSQALTDHASVVSAERNVESAYLSVASLEADMGLKLSASATPIRYSSGRDKIDQSVSLNSSFSSLSGLGASATVRWDSDAWLRKEDESDVTIGVTLDLWPKAEYSEQNLRLIDAREKADLAQAELDVVRNTTVVEVYKTYRLLQIQEARVALQQKAYETQAQLYQQVLDKYKKGLASQSDVLSARVAMEQAKADYKKAARSLSLEIAEFAKALGLDPDKNWQLAPLPETIRLAAVEFSEEDAIRLAEKKSIRLRQAEQAVKAAERSFQAAAADKGLDVSLTGNVSWKQEVSDPSYGAFLSVSYDLFDGGKRKTLIRQQELALAQARDELENVKREIAHTIVDIFSNLDWLSDQVEVAQLNLERSKLEYEGKRAQRQQGLISVLELAEAETELEKSRLNWLEALVNYEAMRLNLLLQTGQALDIEGGGLY